MGREAKVALWEKLRPSYIHVTDSFGRASGEDEVSSGFIEGRRYCYRNGIQKKFPVQVVSSPLHLVVAYCLHRPIGRRRWSLLPAGRTLRPDSTARHRLSHFIDLGQMPLFGPVTVREIQAQLQRQSVACRPFDANPSRENLVIEVF